MFSKKKYQSYDLMCVACLKLVISPIFKCTKEHLLCLNCERIHSDCPVCKDGPENRKRSFRIERIAAKTKFSCSNSQFGCSQQISGRKVLAHEQNDCDYRPLLCSLCPNKPPRLSWHSFLRHYRHYHQCEEYESDTHSVDIYKCFSYQNNRFSGILLNCHRNWFLIVIEIWLCNGDTLFLNLKGKCIQSPLIKKATTEAIVPFRLQIDCERNARQHFNKTVPVLVDGQPDSPDSENLIDLHFKTESTKFVLVFKILPN